MDSTYGEFQGTDLDPNLDFDFEDEPNDLLPILGLAAALAAVVGAMLVLIGRRKEPSAAEQAQVILEQAGKQGKKGLKAASKAVEDANLADLLEEALHKARHTAHDADLEGLLKQAQKKAREARDQAGHAVEGIDFEEIASGARKGAKAVAAVDLASMLQDAIGKARDLSDKVDVSGIQDAAHDAGKRAAKLASNGHMPNVDLDKAGHFLDDLKEKLVEAIDAVREEVAPRAMDTLKGTVIPGAQDAVQNLAHRVQDDVMPAAHDAMGRLRDDVIPAAQERAGHIAEEEVAPRARKAATAVKSGTGSLTHLLQTVGLAVIEKMIQDILPQARNAGAKAVKKAQEDVFPAAAETASNTAHHVRDDVLPRMGEAAAQTPDMLTDVLQMARDKVAEAIDAASPVVADAASGVKSKGKGASGAVSTAVGGAVSATTHATSEFTRILFWLAALGTLILLVFVPDRNKQEEIWNNMRQFLGEVREMWRDLQGPDATLDGESDAPTYN